MSVPIYLFTGFLESGKTTLIKETFKDEGFYEGEKTVVILCEEGEVVFETDFLKEYNMFVVTCDKEENFNAELLEKIEAFYHPDRVMIEFNGTWSVKRLYDLLMPEHWVLAQVIATVDASTFPLYMNAMRSIMYEQLFKAELIICNRCDETTKKSVLRGNIKAINKFAQIIYEGKDGSINSLKEDELPFNTDADELTISDDDYGLWYMDLMENPMKYDGKIITVSGEVLQTGNVGTNAFVLGRYAMVCCNDDTQPVALLCEGKLAQDVKMNEWVTITAYVHVQETANPNEEMPVFVIRELKHIEPMSDPLVYFN